MKSCPSCGNANLDRARFCEQCGARLPELADAAQPLPEPIAVEPQTEEELERDRAEQRQRAAAGLPPAWMPPPVQPSFAPESGWRSLDDVPPEPKKKRRTLLWIIGGVLGLCIIVCVGLTLGLEYTETGRNFISNAETQIAANSTEQAAADALATPTAATPIP